MQGSRVLYEPRRYSLPGLQEYSEFGVWGLGFGVMGSGFRVQGLGFRVEGSEFGVWGSGFGIQGLHLS